MKKTQRELFEEIQAKLTEINPDWDIGSSSIDYQAHQVLSELIADAYDYAERAANSLDIDSADLAQLRNIAYTLGLPLKNQTSSTTRVDFSPKSDNEILVPAGTRILNSTGDIFVLRNSAVAKKYFSTNSEIYSLQLGPIGVESDMYVFEDSALNEIMQIYRNPNADFVSGLKLETELELKNRIKSTAARNGINTVDALKARLQEESLIKEVIIYTNRNEYPIDMDGNQVPTGTFDSLNARSTLILIDFNYPEDSQEEFVTDEMQAIAWAAIAESYSVAENLNSGNDSMMTPAEYTGDHVTAEQQSINSAGVNRIIGGSKTTVTFYAVSRYYVELEIVIRAPRSYLSEASIQKVKDSIMLYSQGGYASIGLRNKPYAIGEPVNEFDFYLPVQIAIANLERTEIDQVTIPQSNQLIPFPKTTLAIFKEANISITVI